MSLDVLASMVDISWFFQGIEEFKKIVVRNFIVKITGVSIPKYNEVSDTSLKQYKEMMEEAVKAPVQICKI